MKFNLIKQSQIKILEVTELESIVNSEIVINEREDKSLPRYYAKFEHSDILDGAFLVGSYGNGNTIDEALINLAKEIECKTLVINAWTKERREYKLPNLKHTKLLNK